MSVRGPSDQFSYPGQLVFPRFYRTSSPPDFDPDNLTAGFDKYQRAKYPEQNQGYRPLQAVNMITGANQINLGSMSLSDSLRGFGYVQDYWKEIEIEIGGSLQGHPHPEPKSLEVYWTPPQYMMFRGPKSAARSEAEPILNQLPSGVNPTRIQFDSEFFLWAIRKLALKKIIDSDLSLKRLTGCQVSPESDNDRETAVKGSASVEEAPELLVRLLKGDQIRAIHGDFIAGGSYVTAEVNEEGSTRVQVAREPLGKLEPIKQLAVSMQFVRDLLSLYDSWRALPEEQKYPGDMSQVLRDKCCQVGYDPLFSPEDSKRDGTGSPVKETVQGSIED